MGMFLGMGQKTGQKLLVPGSLRVSPQIPEAQNFLLEWRREKSLRGGTNKDFVPSISAQEGSQARYSERAPGRRFLGGKLKNLRMGALEFKSRQQPGSFAFGGIN